jgi:uncharacterized protein YceH (UPF0502 family)
VLGVLVEKAKTTPEAYPLSLNALVTGCNQKSNRDPILELSDLDVEDTLLELQKKGLVNRITGGRVEKWRHVLYEAWHTDKVELAILAELLLRGPQTEGELRGRASRMESIDDLDTLRALLKRLAERQLVVYLTPEGKRGTTVTHGFHPPQELERLRKNCQAASVEAAAADKPISEKQVPVPVAGNSSWEGRLAALESEVAALRSLVTELQSGLSRLSEDLHVVKQGLGL